MTDAPLASPKPSYLLAVVSAIHAAVFAAGAVVAPSATTSWFALTLAPLALLHLALCALSFTGRLPARLRVWLAVSLYSLLWLAALTWVIASGALYLAEIYGGMGEAVAIAMLCIWGLIVLFTIPISLWGLVAVRPRWLWRRGVALTALAVVTAATLASCSVGRLGRATPVSGALASQLESKLAGIARQHPGTPHGRVPASVLQLAPIDCAEPITKNVSLLVTTLERGGRPTSTCLQTSGLAELAGKLSELLAGRAAADAPVKLDLIVGVQALVRMHPLIDSLSLRPALDGLCAGARCFAPWQLVAQDAFTQNHPMESMRDASFGVSLASLTHALGVPMHAELSRIETASWLLDQRGLQTLVRGRPLDVPVDDSSLERAVAAAGAHIVAAERADGTFRYTLDPFNGRTDDRMVSMRRQAGTVFAICELLPKAQVAEPAARALALLRTFEQRHGELAMLTDKADIAEIGPSALPLIAFAACRDAIGPVHDDLIGGMTRFLLTMQRENGAFYPELVLATGQPRGEHESLYSGGQAMLALVLVEQLVQASPSPHWPSREALADGVERAMNYYGNHYWPRPLRSLFFLEENWHCLAARAALRSHRNADYEDFCLDYARYKQRWILQRGASPEHVGGYSMSDIFPPHAAVTGGFGEVLSAALEIEHARGMDLREHQATLRDVLGFLLRSQWTAQNCFACGANGEAIGGFSEHTASPKIRIDYVQHVMAGLAHGKQALALKSKD
jgi:hypothetical protein